VPAAVAGIITTFLTGLIRLLSRRGSLLCTVLQHQEAWGQQNAGLKAGVRLSIIPPALAAHLQVHMAPSSRAVGALGASVHLGGRRS
jgi:hypothetical protein